MPSARPSLVLASLTLCGVALAQGGEDTPPRREAPVDFARAVATFMEAVERAAPDGVRVEVADTTPGELGWKARDGKAPARVVTVWTPNGAARAVGLLPRGDYRPLPPDPDPSAPRAHLLGVSEHLVLVGAPGPEVALTMDAMEEARPLLARALAPLDAVLAGDEVPAGERPAALRGALRVVRHRHWLEVELPEGHGALALDALWTPGVLAVAWRERPERGLIPPYRVAARP